MRLADSVLPGVLWGHAVRGLVSNPVFALLPLLYLELFDRFRSPLGALWLAAFVLGYPHAGYTALEIRHYFLRYDGVADARTLPQLLFFSAYGVVGGALAVWYVERGAAVLAGRSGLPVHLVMALLALGGAVGTVMGLRDVLVMDLALRPGRVIRAAAGALLRWRWLRFTMPWAAVQLALAEGLRALR